MTLEQQFFKEFEIEINCGACRDMYCVHAQSGFKAQQCSKHLNKFSITSDIILGLFKILQNAVKLKYPKTIALEINIDKDFREEVLYGLIQLKEETYDQVRALFNAR